MQDCGDVLIAVDLTSDVQSLIIAYTTVLSHVRGSGTYRSVCL